MRPSFYLLTIDGPVASGKGTVAREIAQTLGFHLLDSGAIYRAFALSCIEKNIDVLKINALADEAKALSLNFQGKKVLVNDKDATAQIRAESVGMLASKLSAIPEVRAGLLERQRAFAREPGLVADGRDMGTVVFPDATLKIYLTATADVRGSRRFGQLSDALDTDAAKPQLDDVVAQIRTRDLQDKSRAIAPLKPAPDAIVIDNARQTKQETIERILALWSIRTRAS
jgi:cytidylate kinase